MTKIKDLIPGDIVVGPFTGDTAVFVGAMQHPLYPRLQLVIWFMDDRNLNEKHGQWSHDALDAEQDVGTVFLPYLEGAAEEGRRQNLRRVLGQ